MGGTAGYGTCCAMAGTGPDDGGAPLPHQVANVPPVAEIAVGAAHACALLMDGTVSCWGKSFFGENGSSLGSYDPAPPHILPSLSGVQHVIAINYVSGAVLADGTVKCWGDDRYGQLGNGATVSTATPVTLQSIPNLSKVVLGAVHGCALITDGTVKCWGNVITQNSDDIGRLGNGTTDGSFTPVTVPGLSDVTDVVLGGHTSCVIRNDDTVSCWGDPTYGPINHVGITSLVSLSPVVVAGLSDVTQLALGENHLCALLADGTAKCWGYNGYGQLGDGTTVNSAAPVAVRDLSDATELTAAFDSSCALHRNGQVSCWGHNHDGQLGDGTKDDSTTPVLVPDLSNAVHIASDVTTVCALLQDHTVHCWGYRIEP